MRLSTLRRRFSASFASLMFLFLIATAAKSQEKQYSENKADMALKSAARVDPSTLGMSLEIPFGGAPGRGGTSLNSTIRYSSKQWRIKYSMGWHSYINYNVWTRPSFSENSMAGWTSSLDPPRIEYSGRNQAFDNEGNPLSDDPTAEYNEVCYIPRITLHLPDGSSTELRKSDTQQCFSPWEPNPDFSGTFYSIDGTGMRFNSDTGVLNISDGGRYLFGPEQIIERSPGQFQDGRWANQYIDNNGNVLSYSFTNATDTLGRTYANALPNTPVVGDQNYSIAGFGGQNLNYILRWRNLADVLSDPASGLRYTSNKKCLGPNNYQPVSPYLFVSSYPTHVCAAVDLFNPIVLSQVVLPNGQSYQFKYNAFGEIDKITYPTGGYERFLYGEVRPLGDLSDPYDQANRGVVERWVSAKGDGTDETHWLYAADFPNNTYRITITSPDQTRTERLLHVAASPSYFGFENPLAGMAFEERSYSAANQMVRRNLTQWSTITPAGGHPRNPHVTKTVGLILDTTGNALATTTISQHDQDLNVTAVDKFDFYSINQTTAQTGAITSLPSGALMRRDESTYLVNDTSIAAGVRQIYRDHNLTRLLSSSRIRNSANDIVAQAALVYDEASKMLPSYGSVTGWIDPQTNPRGLATTMRSWLDISSAWQETHAYYDRCGNLRKTTDALGHVSEVLYDSGYHYAYPTQTISADPDGAGPVTALTTSTVYDLSSGMVTSTVDANNWTTSFEYAATDTLGNSNALQRLTKTTQPDGGWTAYGYSDQPGNLFVRTKSALDASRNIESTKYFDGLGRGWRDVQSEGATSIYVDTQFDSMGRAWKVSKPYRGGETVFWTTTGFDALGREISLTTPDNALISTTYEGNTVIVADQTSKKRKSVNDALGRLTQVYEDPAGVNYATTYKYDVLGNLRKVEQGSQVRFFMYDSLSRLIRVKNAEHENFTPDGDFPALTDSTSGTSNSQWSMAYNYNANGSIVKRKDARNKTTTYVYDALNRNTNVEYSDATPDTLLQYDLATKGKGRLNQVWQSGSTTSATYIDSYDAMGRPLLQRQRFETNGAWSGDYQTQRTYNLASGLTSQTYPSGRTINYTYDDAGRTSSFTGNIGDGVTRTYTTGISYSEWGGMKREQFGTDIPLYHKQKYTDRGQLWDMRVSTVDDDWNWNRGAIVNYFSLSNFVGGGIGTDTNGNLYIQQHWIPHNDQVGAWTMQQQNYDYDSLNRITWVGEYLFGSAISGTHTGAQHFTYDRWGNRLIHAVTWGTGINNKQFIVDPSNNNRLGVPGGQSGVMSFDATGNLTTDSYSGNGSRTYDAENRMTSAQGINQGNWQYYTYNGTGQRVRRKVEGVETWQVYGMGGELLAEYAASSPATSPQREYGYRNGQLLVIAEPAGAPAIMSDDFNDNVRDTTKWNLYAVGPNPSPTYEQNGRLEIQSQYSATHSNYGGYVTAATHNLNGKQTSVEVVQPTTANGGGGNYAGLSWGDSPYRIMMTYSYIYYDNTGFTIDPVRDRHIRLRDDPATQTVYYESSPNGSTWEVRASRSRGAASLDYTVRLYNGNTAGWTSVDLVKFDNFRLEASGSQGSGNGIRWLVADHLGTPRMIFDQTGALANVKRHDYLPFGEELFAGVGGRTTQNGYTGDTIRQKFTGYERDGETGLDFAQARYHASVQGRFTSVDPANAASEVSDPQSWNGYSYVLNNPLNMVDRDGLSGCAAEFSSCDGDSDAGTPDSVKRARARYESIIETGYDPELGRYRGEVEIEHIPEGGGYSQHRTLHNPTQAQVNQAMDSMLGASDLLAQRGGGGGGKRSRGGPGSNPKSWRWVQTGPGRGQWQYTGPGSWTYGTGRPPRPPSGTAFNSFSSFKRAFGSAGYQREWHHIVGQTDKNVSRFGPNAIHNTNNLVSVSKEFHHALNAYYSSHQSFTRGQTVREWLSNQSFEAQHANGVRFMRQILTTTRIQP